MNLNILITWKFLVTSPSATYTRPIVLKRCSSLSNNKEGPTLSKKLASENEEVDWGILSTLSSPSSTLALFQLGNVFRDNTAKPTATVASPIKRSIAKVSPTFNLFALNFFRASISLAVGILNPFIPSSASSNSSDVNRFKEHSPYRTCIVRRRRNTCKDSLMGGIDIPF